MDLNILRKEIKQKRLSLDYQKFELYNRSACEAPELFQGASTTGGQKKARSE